jgi:hypothetical protein
MVYFTEILDIYQILDIKAHQSMDNLKQFTQGSNSESLTSTFAIHQDLQKKSGSTEHDYLNCLINPMIRNEMRVEVDQDQWDITSLIEEGFATLLLALSVHNSLSPVSQPDQVL